MYIPVLNALDDVDEIRALVAAAGTAELVTVGADGYPTSTWNYSAVHLTGRARVRTDEAWLRRAVSLLTDHHEQGRAAPWQVTDAPEGYVTRHLRGVVGVELRVERVEAKAKLSQNRSADDHAGVVDGLAAEPGTQPAAVADAMRRTGGYR